MRNSRGLCRCARKIVPVGIRINRGLNTAESPDWVSRLDRNESGRPILTTGGAGAVAARAPRTAWFIAPFATKWAVGCEARDLERYFLLGAGGEPLCFESRADAADFLKAFLSSDGRYVAALKRFAQPIMESALSMRAALISVLRTLAAPHTLPARGANLTA